MTYVAGLGGIVDPFPARTGIDGRLFNARFPEGLFKRFFSDNPWSPPTNRC